MLQAKAANFVRKKPVNGNGKILTIICNLYSAGLLAFFLMRFLTNNERLWQVAVIGNFLHLVLLPALILFPVMLVLKRWQPAAMLGINALVFAWLYGGLFLPHNHRCEDCLTLRVMTFNILADGAADDGLIPLLRHSGADIILLQEVGLEEGEEIPAGLSDLYPYQSIVTGAGDYPGNAIFSVYPIVDQEWFSDHQEGLPFFTRATIDVNGQPLNVMNIHTMPPTPYWHEDLSGYCSYAIDEMSELVDMALADAPTILAGDLNMSDQSCGYNPLHDAGLHDAFREAGTGFGLTFPAPGNYQKYPDYPIPPLMRIDHILYTDHFNAQRAWVGPNAGSDHLPVLAELAWE